jgi:hypothetical protein
MRATATLRRLPSHVIDKEMQRTDNLYRKIGCCENKSKFLKDLAIIY